MTQTADKPRRSGGAALTRADLSAREKAHLRACVHEASHAVVCVLLGGQVGTAVVTNGWVFGVEGVTHFTALPDGIDPAVTFAGMWGPLSLPSLGPSS